MEKHFIERERIPPCCDDTMMASWFCTVQCWLQVILGCCFGTPLVVYEEWRLVKPEE